MTSRALILTRQSITEATDVSLDAQEDRCRAYCHERQYAVVTVTREESVRGWRDDRVVIAQALHMAKAGAIDVVVSWDVSRVARSVRILENLVHELKQHGARLESVSEPWVADDTLMRQILSAFAEKLTQDISRNVTSAKAAAARMGRWQGSNPPFGYQLVKVGDAPSVLIPDEREAPIIHEIFERMAKGEPSTAIARDLVARGIPSRIRADWPSSWLRAIVANPVYLGCVSYKGDVVAHAAHPPLIDETLWQRANEQMSRRTVVRHNDRKPGHWLEGHVIHACGMRMYLWSRRHDHMASGWQQLYMCRSVYDDGKARHECCHERKRLSALVLTRSVRECLKHDLAALPSVQNALRRAKMAAGGAEASKQRERLDTRRATAHARYERVRAAWASGNEPLEWLDAERARRDAALAEIDAELAALPEPPNRDEYERIATQLQEVAAVIDMADDKALTPFIAMLGRVCVSEAGVSIVYWPGVSSFVPVPHIATLPTR